MTPNNRILASRSLKEETPNTNQKDLKQLKELLDSTINGWFNKIS